CSPHSTRPLPQKSQAYVWPLTGTQWPSGVQRKPAAHCRSLRHGTQELFTQWPAVQSVSRSHAADEGALPATIADRDEPPEDVLALLDRDPMLFQALLCERSLTELCCDDEENSERVEETEDRDRVEDEEEDLLDDDEDVTDDALDELRDEAREEDDT